MLDPTPDERRILDGIRGAEESTLADLGAYSDTWEVGQNIAEGLARLLTVSREGDSDIRVATKPTSTMASRIVGYLSRGYLQ